MSQGKYQNATKLYADLMGEVARRIYSIEAVVQRPPAGVPTAFVREFCFLQIRMVCELVALGCLVAHGDMTANTKLDRVWEADKIMKALEKLHSDFFPQPARYAKAEDGSLQIQARQTKLDKASLLRIYYTCGGKLHKGTLKNVLDSVDIGPVDLKDVFGIAQDILSLLEMHMIFMLGAEHCLGCHLGNPGNGYVTTAFTADAVSPPPP